MDSPSRCSPLIGAGGLPAAAEPADRDDGRHLRQDRGHQERVDAAVGARGADRGEDGAAQGEAPDAGPLLRQEQRRGEGPPPGTLTLYHCCHSHVNNISFQALVMKQFLSDEKIDEINEIIEMKITHRKNIERRKTRFGFESTSKMGLNMAGAAVIIPDGSDGTDPENPYADGK